MNVVDTLMKGVRADLEVLRVLKEKGDDFSRFRNVTFLFRCPDKEKAEFVSGFLADHNLLKLIFFNLMDSLVLRLKSTCPSSNK